MKYLKFIALTLLAGSLTLSSCSKDDDNDDNSGGSFFECKIDGQQFRFTDTEAYAVDFSGDDYTVYGSDILGSPATTIYLNLLESSGEGTFDVGFTGQASGYVVLNDGSDTYTTLFGTNNGTITVTKFDPPNFEGTFSFTANHTDNITDVVEVTDGKFKVEFR